MRYFGFTILLIVFVVSVSLMSHLPVLAQNHQYFEDFFATQHRDILATTAWWDTLAGEIRLYEFEGMTLISSNDTPDYADDIVIEGDHAFVADEATGLLVFDISDPSAPSLAGSYDTAGIARSVEVAGDYAIVADDHAGIVAIDISDPSNPSLLGTYNTPGFAYDVAISGDMAFVADDTEGLQIIDISDPTNPSLVGSYNTPGFALGVGIAGDWAYVIDATHILVFDISDPTNPTMVRSEGTPEYSQAIAIEGDYAYVANGAFGILVFNISITPAIWEVTSLDTPGFAYRIFISGDYAYVADGDAGLLEIDITDPHHPVLNSSYDTSGTARGCAVAGVHTYVADRESGLAVVNVANLVSPAVLVGSCATPGVADDVAQSGDYALVADQSSGLEIFDIGDPTNPILVGSYDTPGTAGNVAITGKHVYVADHAAGMQVIDITDPGSPTLLATYSGLGIGWDVAIAGDYAILVGSFPTLHVIDISDPTNPTQAGSCNTGDFVIGVAVAGDYAYLAAEEADLQVIDISNPTNPILAGSCNVAGYAIDIALAGDHAYLAYSPTEIFEDAGGLKVFDITDPTNPTLVGSCNEPHIAYDVVTDGDLAYVAGMMISEDGDYGGLHVIDISDPYNPVPIEIFDTPGTGYGIERAGDYAFLADSDGGLQVIQVAWRMYDRLNNLGQSLPLDQSDVTIASVKIATAQTDSISWNVSADNGLTWQRFLPGDLWRVLSFKGSDLLWRSTHDYQFDGINPACSYLQVDWLFEGAAIDSIVDVPGDQGGQVRIYTTRSGYDIPDEQNHPVTMYYVWRRIDDLPATETLQDPMSPATSGSRGHGAAGSPATMAWPEYLGQLPLTESEGRFLLRSFAQLTSQDFPPGTWEIVGSMPGAQQDQYIHLTPTLADSMDGEIPFAVYLVSAHTTEPLIWFLSLPDSGYSVDNIEPAIPTGLAVAYAAAGNQLSWSPSPDEDFQYFKIYRGPVPDFVPAPENLVHLTSSTDWLDEVADPWDHHYQVAAVDHAGNESAAASPETVVDVEGASPPTRFVLYPNSPNPFNPSTTIRFDVPAGGCRVVIEIFNAQGRLVRKLWDDPTPAGMHRVAWQGTDHRERRVATGVYFCRLRAPAYTATLKMLLIQ